MLSILFLTMLLQPPALDEAGDPLPTGAIKRLGSTRWRTAGPATGEMHFSLDGKVLYHIGAYEGKARAIDVANGKELFRFETPDDQRLSNGALSKDGRWMVCVGYLQSSDEDRRTIMQGTHLFDAQTGRHLRTWKEKSQSKLTISSDGSLIARCVYHEETGEQVHVSDIATGEELFQWHEGKGSGVLSLQFRHDDQQLYIVKYPHENGKFMTLYVVNAQTGKTESQRVLERMKNITYHDISQPDGLLAFYDRPSMQIRIEELLNGKERKALPFTPSKKGEPVAFQKGGEEGGPNVGLAFSNDGTLLAVAEGAHGGDSSLSLQLLLYDTRTWQRKQAWNLERRWIANVAISNDNKTLAVGGSSNAIMLFDIATGKQRNEAVNHNPPSDIRCVCFSPDGHWLALAGHDPTIELWNARTWKLEKRWKSPMTLMNAVSFSPDGSRLLTGGYGVVHLWEIPTGKLLLTIKSPTAYILSVAWLDQGKTIAIGGQGQQTLRLYDANTGKELAQHSVGGSNRATFSAKGQLWMNDLQLISTRTGEIVATVPVIDKASIYQIGYSHQSLLTVNARQVTTIYERATMQQRWKAQQPGIVSAFSVDGRWLACSHGWDQSVRATPISIRDALTGKERCQFEGQVAMQRLAFSPDGLHLVSAGSDGTALVWQLPALPAALPWSEDEARKNWDTLAGDDVPKAAHALARFLDTPTETLAFIRKHLPPVPIADAEQVKGAIDQLASPKFAEREKAYQQLKQLGSLAEPMLRSSLNGKLEVEPRRRVEMLLAEIQTLQLTPAERQALRAVEIAERINTPASRELMVSWSKGAAGARLTRLARECCE